MHFNVPQFIEVEDKIAFQLTAKQLAWFALGGVILYIVYQYTGSTAIFFVIGFFVVAICSAFAFLRIAGMSLIGFLLGGFRYVGRPKTMIWKRKAKIQEEAPKPKPKKDAQKDRANRYMKEKALQEVENLADTLDKQSRI